MEDIDFYHEGVLADLRKADLRGKEVETVYKEAGADSITMFELGTHSVYRQDGKSLLLVGTENQLSLLHYEQPEEWLHFPLPIGDSLEGTFKGRGSYCDRLFMYVFGHYLTAADAEGLLLLPSGDTLRHVTRLRTERVTSCIYLPLDSVMARHKHQLLDVPSLDDDMVAAYITVDTARMKTVASRYYAPGYRYPILETTEIGPDDGNVFAPYLSTAFYAAPDEQEKLAWDTENIALRMMAHDENGNDGGITGGFNYTLTQQADSRLLTVDYNLETAATLRLLVCDAKGIMYSQATQQAEKGTGSISIGYGGLPHGQYILYIEVMGERFAEKFAAK